MRGILHQVDGTISYYGTPRNVPADYTWQDVTEPTQIELLETEVINELRWDGTAVVLRSAEDLAEIERQTQIDNDDQFITSDHLVAFAKVVLAEINRLRALHDLDPRTPQQVRDAFHQALNR
jgi:hypothetical protein